MPSRIRSRSPLRHATRLRALACLLAPTAMVARQVRAQSVDSAQAAAPAASVAPVVAMVAPAVTAPGVVLFVTAGAGLRSELLSTSTLFRVGLGAIADQARWQPMGWGGAPADFGARAGVRLAEVTVQLAALHGTAALLGQDASYRPQYEGSFFDRAGHALLGSVTAHNRAGDRVFAPGTIVGALAAGVTAQQLLPSNTPRAEITSRAVGALTSRVLRTLWMEFLTRPPRVHEVRRF